MNESMDRVLADWLREGPETGPREGLERALAATRRVGQKPGWALPERWLPMQLTMARTPALRPLLSLVVLALLAMALVATALLIGANQRRVPPPFGPARNGAIVYAEGGDLFLADQLGAPPRVLVDGPESDGYPLFSNQGERVAFVRTGDGDFDVMSVAPDGSDVRTLGELPGEFNGFTWSPTGDALLVNLTEEGISGFRFVVVKADGSGMRALDLPVAADYGSWRPDGRQIVFRGHDPAAGASAAYIADADGTNVQRLDIPATQDVDFESLSWSPDGAHVSFMSDGSLGGVTGWQINIADISAAGTVTDLHRLKLDANASDERGPTWSPDSSRLAFLLEKDFRRQVGMFNADGTGLQLVGPETSTSNILGYAWSPDGRTLLISQFPDYEPAREAQRKQWSIDVQTLTATEVQTPIGSWQRLAP